MHSTELLKKYLIALEKALNNDHINYGYLVKDYTFFVEPVSILPILEDYIESLTQHKDFTNLVEDYFFSKSHYQNFTGNVDNEIIKDNLLRRLSEIKKECGL